jgi:hypothetical protein
VDPLRPHAQPRGRKETIKIAVSPTGKPATLWSGSLARGDECSSDSHEPRASYNNASFANRTVESARRTQDDASTVRARTF